MNCDVAETADTHTFTIHIHTMSERRRIWHLLTGLALLCAPVDSFTPAPWIRSRGHSKSLMVANKEIEEVTEEGEVMSAQERILRDAGLWEEQEGSTCTTKKEENTGNVLQEQQSRNVVVAVVSVVLAIANFFWQYSHPVTEVQLLFSMQQSSAPIELVGTNGKPSVVDFWAPWCENCKFAAPTLNKVEEEYRDRVNFVMVNGDQAQAWPYLEAFRVDAIPHLALVSADGDVITALVGPTPKSVLEADLDVLINNAKQQDSKQQLPYVMLDVFANAPERRRVHFEE